MGIPNVKGVWCHEVGGGRLFNIISIKQAYPGHGRQAELAAAQCAAGAYLGRYVIVVDDDIDPTSTFDVIWAIATRSDPEQIGRASCRERVESRVGAGAGREKRGSS